MGTSRLLASTVGFPRPVAAWRDLRTLITVAQKGLLIATLEGLLKVWLSAHLKQLLLEPSDCDCLASSSSGLGVLTVHRRASLSRSAYCDFSS